MNCGVVYGSAAITGYTSAHKIGAISQVSSSVINWEFLQPSTTTFHDPQLGEMKFWDIVVENEPVLRDAAWMYVNPPEGQEGWKDKVSLRTAKYGDPGNPNGMCRTKEKDGVVVQEDWFG